VAKQVSEDIVAYCTSCKLDLAHVIVAIDGEKIIKVLCKTCKKEHVYKPPREGRAPSDKSKLTRISRKKTLSPPEVWQRAMEEAKDAPVRIYSQDGSFSEGEKVNHSTFGQGLITKLIRPNKMEVIFEAGTKLMIRGSL
jgi:hypothetical protein